MEDFKANIEGMEIKVVTIDSHFHGITPLYSGTDPLIEYAADIHLLRHIIYDFWCIYLTLLIMSWPVVLSQLPDSGHTLSVPGRAGMVTRCG